MDKGIQDNIPEVAIVILHYINEERTYQCIEAIRKHTFGNSYYIYIIDNNSPNQFVYSAPDLTVIRNDSKHSVPGMNRGFYYALYESKVDYKYIVNLDNDVLVHEN